MVAGNLDTCWGPLLLTSKVIETGFWGGHPSGIFLFQCCSWQIRIVILSNVIRGSHFPVKATLTFSDSHFSPFGHMNYVTTSQKNIRITDRVGNIYIYIYLRIELSWCNFLFSIWSLSSYQTYLMRNVETALWAISPDFESACYFQTVKKLLQIKVGSHKARTQ